MQNGLYKDVFFSQNLKKINESQFDVSWWYRTTFSHLQNLRKQTLFFEGINYKANVWLNGKQIGSSSQVVGAMRNFQFGLDSLQKENALAVQVFKPIDHTFPPDNNSTDLAISFIDWSPHPPDFSMGIFRRVLLRSSYEGFTIDFPLVSTFLSRNNSVATLDIMAEISNSFGVNDTVPVNVTCNIYFLEGNRFSENASLSFSNEFPFSGKSINVWFNSSQFASLVLQNAESKLWWPWQMGKQTMHKLEMKVSVKGEESDSLQTLFGIRQVTSSLTASQYRVFKVNGKNILIRGAGWAPDLFLVFNLFFTFCGVISKQCGVFGGREQTGQYKRFTSNM